MLNVKNSAIENNTVGPLMKIGLLLKKTLLRSLAKSVLISLGLTATASTADEEIRTKS